MEPSIYSTEPFYVFYTCEYIKTPTCPKRIRGITPDEIGPNQT